MKKLRDDFYEYEFECHCCGKLIANDELLDLLQSVRNQFGKAMPVISGTRCPKHNKDVGGEPNSAHLTGEAADIECANNRDRLKLVSLFLKHGINRIGIYETFLHVDVSKTNPQDVMWVG